jgi:5-methyltetrahydropteroyltriglutamate--homocysteine methyltransferase
MQVTKVLRTCVHGMPRIGPNRELKWALESYWAGRSTLQELEAVGHKIRQDNWETLHKAGIDFIPSNDFSFYDHMGDAAILYGAIPSRFAGLDPSSPELLFAMARGRKDALALDMTKWFDTNYHQLVPEIELPLAKNTSSAPLTQWREAKKLGISTTVTLVGPMTFLLRSRSTKSDFRTALNQVLQRLTTLLEDLAEAGVEWVHLHEPSLVEDRSPEELALLQSSYEELASLPKRPKLAVITYFGHVGDAMNILMGLPIDGLGLDFVLGKENMPILERSCETLVGSWPGNAGGGSLPPKVLFAGLVDGRNIWASDLALLMGTLARLEKLPKEAVSEVVVSTSCSLLHVPSGRVSERSGGIPPEAINWLAFAQDKLDELRVLANAASGVKEAIDAIASRSSHLQEKDSSPLTKNPLVQERLAALGQPSPETFRRKATPQERARLQKERFDLPLFPTTTIGSFPQTPELRKARAAWREGNQSDEDYEKALRDEIAHVVALQEELGLDVLVHGEPERDDMVRYFAESLDGFILPVHGWVQSYGSRCVRPPVVIGDVSRPGPITTKWISFAQSLTRKPMKAMLTGPVTMLRWSFVRNDQPESQTAMAIALAIRDELEDLQKAGISTIQVDEPALREGLPLRKEGRQHYLEWATAAFRLISSAAKPDVALHTHMCYADFTGILEALPELDADVISIEAARSQMTLIDEIAKSPYPLGIGPGIYDVHSPRVPSIEEIESLLDRATKALPVERIWVNPDCGLKTRRYEEVRPALSNMVAAAKHMRQAVQEHQ